ncbi:MAG: hypothetical protein K0V04_24265 [Deltaproteobacteria bacterium]|nr:hypothetical protein [Deltaproteobacteria bacterium]
MIGGSIVSSQEDGLAKLAKHARVVLVVIAAVQVGAVALLWVAGGAAEHTLIIPSLISAAIYGGLALWARVAPLPAVLVGFAIYLAGVGLSMAQGGSLFDGILFKVILLALFLNGIASGRQYNEAKKRLGL